MVYRTKTYLAADWDGDKDAIDKLHQWNENDYWGLSFVDVHEHMSSYDTSLYCSIKSSLSERMDMCKTFVLVVGNKTTALTKGACFNCPNYRVDRNSVSYLYGGAKYGGFCLNARSISNKSYVEFECDKAARDQDKIKIVVLYNARRVDRSKCPESVRYLGQHLPMLDGYGNWDYQAIKRAIMD